MKNTLNKLVRLKYKKGTGTHDQYGTVVYLSEYHTEELESKYIMFRPTGMNKDIKIELKNIESWQIVEQKKSN